MTKYYLDTEFIEDGRTIDLISIGIVSEDGREFYVLNADCDWSRADNWVRNNVLSSLPPLTAYEYKLCNNNSIDISQVLKCKGSYIPYNRFADAILEFCDIDTHGIPEFIAYYADYDWVALCQTFGKMIDLPKGFPMYCKDLKQEIDRQGFQYNSPNVHNALDNVHNALDDAKWVKKLSEILNF